MAEGRDAPAAGVGNLRDQSIDVETVEEPAYLRTALLGVIVEMKRRGRELLAEVAIGEAVEAMLATHEGSKELAVGLGNGVEGLDWPPVRRGFGHGNGLEAPQDRRRVLDLG